MVKTLFIQHDDDRNTLDYCFLRNQGWDVIIVLVEQKKRLLNIQNGQEKEKKYDVFRIFLLVVCCVWNTQEYKKRISVPDGERLTKTNNKQYPKAFIFIWYYFMCSIIYNNFLQNHLSKIVPYKVLQSTVLVIHLYHFS